LNNSSGLFNAPLFGPSASPAAISYLSLVSPLIVAVASSEGGFPLSFYWAHHVQLMEWVEKYIRKPGEPRSKGLVNVFSLQKLQLDIPDKELLYILHHIKSNSTE
jgi:hypothetical protein